MSVVVRQNDNNKVNMNDVLGSMSECLIRSNGLADRYEDFARQPDKIKLKLNTKPPREVFYRKTVLRTTLPPPPVLPRRCSCRYLCFGSLASFKCLSCIAYDPEGTGYFCDLCFNNRHPWYRVPHIFLPIEKDESISHTLQVQNSLLEIDRCNVESTRLLNELRKNYDKLENVGDDLHIDQNMRKTGRKAVMLEEKMRDMRRKLREELRKSGPLPLNDEEAAMVIQRLFRGCRVRRVISLLYVEHWVRAWDPTSMRDDGLSDLAEYVSVSVRVVPQFLLRRDVESLRLVREDDPMDSKWTCKRNRARRRPYTLDADNAEEASSVLSTFFECIVARKVTVALAKRVYVRVHDELHNTHFYANLRSGESSWLKPKVLLTEEAPLLLESAGEHRRSPRVNRDITVEYHHLLPS